MSEDIELIAKDILDTAIKVHMASGPGLLESAYQYCHAYELRKRGRRILTEVLLPIVYDGQQIDAGYRIDMLVDNLSLSRTKPLNLFYPSIRHNC